MGRPRKRRANRRRAKLRERLPSPRRAARAALSLLGRHRRSLVALGIGGTAFAAIWGARQWLTTSPRFAIDRVEIRGAELTPAPAIASRLDVAAGPNIFVYDTDAAVARLESSPWIRRAEISRDLPDGLVIELDERDPTALVVAGELYLADEDGELFKRATPDEAVGLDLVAVTGLTRDAIAAEPETAAELVRRAVEVARRWRHHDRPALGEINVDPVRGFTLITAERAIAVRLGTSTDELLDARLALFDRAWSALDTEQRARVAMVHLDQSSSPRRATVAFERGLTANASSDRRGQTTKTSPGGAGLPGRLRSRTTKTAAWAN